MDLEEIKQALKDNADLKKQVLKHLTQETDEGKELLKNHAQAHWDDNIGDKVKEIHSLYDEKVEDVLGVKKKDSQKSSDLVADLLTELKDLRKKKGNSARVKELEKEIETLRSEDKGAYWKEKYEQETKKLENELNEKTQKIEELKTGQKRSSIENEINASLSGIQFNEDIPQGVRDAYVQQVKNELIENAQLEDGKITFNDKDGVIRNDEHKPATAKEIMQSRLKEVIKPQGTPGGGAADDEKSSGKIIKVGEGKDATSKLALDKSKFSTQKEFTDYVGKVLSDQGVPKTDPKYRELQTQAYEELKVSELPMK